MLIFPTWFSVISGPDFARFTNGFEYGSYFTSTPSGAYININIPININFLCKFRNSFWIPRFLREVSKMGTNLWESVILRI